MGKIFELIVKVVLWAILGSVILMIIGGLLSLGPVGALLGLLVIYLIYEHFGDKKGREDH